MTRVCFLGDPDVTLKYELLSRETAREALASYDLASPFENTVAVETISLGQAVSLCNDLDWYVVRFVADVLVQEPSVHEREWLSRPLAEAVRNGDVDPAETGEYLKIYGLVDPATDDREAEESPESPDVGESSDAASTSSPSPDPATAIEERPRDGPSARDEEGAGIENRDDAPREGLRLVEPLYTRRRGEEIPVYDLRPVEGTLVVRLTEREFGA